MMRLIATLLIFVGALGLAVFPTSSHAGGEGPDAVFFSGIEALPLMPGLKEIPDATLIFDSPSGRIVETYAAGVISTEAMAYFYSSSLPQLGWSTLGASSFQREGEVLEIHTIGPVAADGSRTVRFSISPVGSQTGSD